MLKTEEKLTAMEMEKGRMGCCLQQRMIVAGMEHSHSHADAPIACLRAWKDSASRLHHDLLSRDDVHKLLRLGHVLQLHLYVDNHFHIFFSTCSGIWSLLRTF